MSSRNGNTRRISEICSKLTIKTPIRSHWCLPDTFNCQYISYIFLVSPLLTFSKINIYLKTIMKTVKQRTKNDSRVSTRDPDKGNHSRQKQAGSFTPLSSIFIKNVSDNFIFQPFHKAQ